MNKEALLGIIKIINKSKYLILNNQDIDADYFFINADLTLSDLQLHGKNLLNQIKQEAPTFNEEYDTQEELLDAVQDSFNNINNELIPLIEINNYFENTVISYEYNSLLSKEQANNLLILQIAKKILSDYLKWSDALECALLEVSDNYVTFCPNITIESQIIQFIENIPTRVNQGSDCLTPFLIGWGIGNLF